MNNIKITENIGNKSGVMYLFDSLGSLFKDLNGNIITLEKNDRIELRLDLNNSYKDYVKREVEDKIADVIAVRYKYNFFKENMKVIGLSSLEMEILLSGLISADIDEDKKFIIKKLRIMKEYSIDGVVAFRLSKLKQKWSEICEYIPCYFTKQQLKDFICFLIEQKKSKKLIVKNGKVYDNHYNNCQRLKLLDTNETEGKIIREILLSGCGKVELKSKVDKSDEFYLKEYYHNKIFCKCDYFS